MYCIYLIWNLTNNKVYVGQSLQPIHRWQQHKHRLRRNKHHCLHLQNAWNKYGEEVFKHIVIATQLSKEEADFQEILLIGSYRQDGLSYNVANGGHFGPLSTEHRQKLSDSHKGKPSQNKGKKASEETKQKLRESHTGKILPEEQKMKISATLKGRIRSPEHCKKISENKKQWHARRKEGLK